VRKNEISKVFSIQEELGKWLLELILDSVCIVLVYTCCAFWKVTTFHSSLLVLCCNCSVVFCIHFFNLLKVFWDYKCIWFTLVGVK